jgi:FkbM family methyltransferase
MACCRHYLARCEAALPGDPAFSLARCENNADMVTNGELRLLRELAPRLQTVFDVGANAGDWTAQLLPLLPASARVHAFEPCQATCERFLGKGFPPRVRLHRLALSSAAGEAALHVFDASSTLNSLHNRRGLEGGWGIAPSAQDEAVALDTLDAFCARERIAGIDLLKLDTEGHEVDVLLGAKGALATGLVGRVQFEYGATYIDARRLLKDVFELLGPFGYAIHLVAPGGLVACPRYDQRLENFQQKAFVAFHPRCAPA